MPLGYGLEYDVIALNDTAHLQAYLVKEDGNLFDPDDLVSVVFNIQAPDGTRNTYQGIIQDDGTGLLNFNETTIEGHYVAVATFSLADGGQKSTRTSFEVNDAFTEPLTNPTNPVEAVAQAVWGKISGCFDSSDGGPWLREMTLKVFNPTSMENFINEAVLDFNMNQPPSQLTLGDFTTGDTGSNANPMFPIIVEGTFLAVIRHLMRSYVEQPLPQGAQFGWQDRRDYQMRWGQVYQIELEMYKRWVSMAKRGLFGFGLTSLTSYSYSRSFWGPNYRWARGWGVGPGW